MLTDVNAEPAVVTFTRKAPAKMAGHTRVPKSRKAPSAMPVGGQTAEALLLSVANARPSLPAPKYKAVSAAKRKGAGRAGRGMAEYLRGGRPGSNRAIVGDKQTGRRTKCCCDSSLRLRRLSPSWPTPKPTPRDR